MNLPVLQTQNILSIREDTLDTLFCDAEKPKFTKDAVIVNIQTSSDKSFGACKGKYTLSQTQMLLPRLCIHDVYLLQRN